MPSPQPNPFRARKARNPDTGRQEWVLPEGITPWDLRTSRYRRLFNGVYVEASATVTPRLLARAALLLASPTSVASHQTAARIWGGIVPNDGRTHISCVGRRPQVARLVAHRISRNGQEYTNVDGVRVTTPRQTFVDLAGHLGLVDLVVLGDSLVKAELITPEQLVEAAASLRGRSRRLARRAASLVRAEVDSPMESRLRMLMILAGLPEPVVNHTIRWPNGIVRFRFDLSYPDHRLIIEYDGRQHAEGRQWDIDVDRREWMDGKSWRLVVVRSKDIYRTPALTLSRIMGAMRDKGMGVPRLSDEWREHFPSLPEDVAEPA
jgi:very-short-patch-repair endonuclease